MGYFLRCRVWCAETVSWRHCPAQPIQRVMVCPGGFGHLCGPSGARRPESLLHTRGGAGLRTGPTTRTDGEILPPAAVVFGVPPRRRARATSLCPTRLDPRPHRDGQSRAFSNDLSRWSPIRGGRVTVCLVVILPPVVGSICFPVELAAAGRVPAGTARGRCHRS
jgi:hypothetical protein